MLLERPTRLPVYWPGGGPGLFIRRRSVTAKVGISLAGKRTPDGLSDELPVFPSSVHPRV